MCGVSTSVAICNYLIPSALGVVLFSVSTGFFLSLDLSQVGTLCKGPRATFKNHGLHSGGLSPSLPTSFGWNLGCRELLVYLSLLLVAMSEAGLLHHFFGSAQTQNLITGPQGPVSYLLIILFFLCCTLREIQGAYLLGGTFLNPLYPKGISNNQAFQQKNRGLYIAAAIRRVLLYLGKIVMYFFNAFYAFESFSIETVICKPLWVNVTDQFLVFDLLHSDSICNDCFSVHGHVSAVTRQGLRQRGIHTSL